MQGKSLTYSTVFQRFYGLLMIVLLLWLTVSPPVAYEAEQDLVELQEAADEADPANPLSNTAEEKAGAGGNTLLEYLHELQAYQPACGTLLSTYKTNPDDLYSAFHPEKVSPPPEQLL
jgi:hypothetical protein